MKVDATLANAAWFAASLPEWVRYRHAAANVEATQRHLLDGYLRKNAATEFGREHDFASIRNWDEYSERVPIRTYDEIQPWIERIASGSTGVLTAEPVDLLEPSSGSSGPEKWVPYTKTLQAEFRRAVAVWISQNFINCPDLMRGRAYWCLTPQAPRDRSTSTRVRVGFDEDSAYLGGIAQRLIEMTLVTPPALRHISDMDRFWHVSLLVLLKCRDLRLISVWHPSYVLLLLEHLRSDWSRLLHDLNSGLTLTTPRLRIEADPSRANELEALGHDDAAAIWPELRLISCWGDAHAKGCLADIGASFPSAQLQAKGLLATEAFATLPLDEFKPLAIRSHFFEFRDERGTVRPAWALNQGEVYSLVVTTGGGLYRYRLQDRVEVTGYYKDVPSLRFLGKEDNVADFFGEKLTESFVVSSLDVVFARHKIKPQFSMIAMDKSGGSPGYALYVQSVSGLPAELDTELDAELRRNPHYDLCVRLGQLKHVRVVPIVANAYETYSQALTKRGMRLGDIKPTPLSRFTDWSEQFADTAMSHCAGGS